MNPLGIRRTLAPRAARGGASPITRGLRSSYAGIKAGLGGAEDLLGTAIGSKTLQSQGQQTFEQNALAAQREAPAVNDLTQIHNVDSFINYSLGKVGELIPFAASLAVGGGVGRAAAGEAGQFAGITGVSGAIQGGQNFEAAKQAGATPQQAVAPAAVSGLGQGALDAILGAQFAKNLQGKLANVPGQAALGAGVNAAQTAASQAAVSVAHPATPLFTREHAKEILNSAAAGGIGGAVLGGATRALGGLRRTPSVEPSGPSARERLIAATQNAPVAAQRAPDLSYEDLQNLTTHEPGGRVYLNKSYVRKSASEIIAGKKFAGNSLTRTVDKLNKQNDGSDYQLVSLKRMVQERAAQKFRTAPERLTYTRTQAYHKFDLAVKQNPAYARLFNPSKPEDFLDHFVVIQKTAISPILRTGSSLDLTKEDISNTLRTPKNELDIRRGEFTVLDNGKPKRINAMDLTIAGMKRTPATGATVTPHRAAEAFFTGLTSLLEKNPRTGTATISLEGDIPDKTIIFTSKRGREITYGDLKQLAPSANDALVRDAASRHTPDFIAAKAGKTLHYQRRAELAKEGLGRPDQVMGLEGTQRKEALPSSPPSEAEKQLVINRRFSEQAAAIKRTESDAEAARIYKQATGEDAKGLTRDQMAKRVLAERRSVSRGRVEPPKQLTDLQSLADKLSTIKGVLSLSDLRERFKGLYNEEGTTVDRMIQHINGLENKNVKDWVLRKALLARKEVKAEDVKPIYRLFKALTHKDPTGVAPRELLKQIERKIGDLKRTVPEKPASFEKTQLEKNPRVETDHALRSLDYSLQFTKDRNIAAKLYKSTTGQDPGDMTIAQMRSAALAKIAPTQELVMTPHAKGPGSETLNVPLVSLKDAQTMRKLDARLEKAVKRTPALDKLFKDTTGIDPKDMTTVQMRRAAFTVDKPVTSRTNPNTNSMAAEGTNGLGKIEFPDLIKRGAPDEALQAKARDLTKQLGLAASIKIVPPDEFLINAPEKIQGVLDGTYFGGTYTEKSLIGIFLHPNLKGKARDEVFAHEFGHAVLKAKVLEMSDGEASALLKDYQAWKGGVHTVGDVLNSLKIGESKRLLSQALGDKVNRELGGDKFSKYLTSFPEWFADNVAKWIEQKVAPKTTTEKFFAKIGQAIRLLTSKLRPGVAVQDYMDSLVARSGRWTLPLNALDALRALHVPGTDSEILAASSEASSPGSATYRKLTEDMFLNKLTPEERQAVGQAAMSLSVQRQFRKLGLANKPDEDIMNDPLAASITMYQLWQVGKIRIGPAADKIFGNARQEVFDRFGKITNDRKAVEIFQAVRSGLIDLRDTSPGVTEVGRVVNETRTTRMFHQATRAYSHIAPVFQGVFSAASDRLIKTNNPYLAKLANMIEVRVGSEYQAEGMLASRSRLIAEYDNKISSIFKDKTADFGRQTLESLQKQETRIKDPELRKAVAGVRAVLRNVRRYAIKSGLDVGDRGSTYFPWVFDTEYMASHSDEFRKLLSQPKYKEFLGENPQQSIEQSIQNILDHGGLSSKTTSSDNRLVPTMSALNERSLNWIADAGNDKDRADLARFFDKDLGHTLRVYGEQAIKRAEFTKRFGGGELEKLLGNAQKFGASEKDVQLAKDYMQGVMGLAGVKTHQRLYKALNLLPDKILNALDIKPPVPGQPINRTLQKAMGVMMVYQNVRILGLATLSSISDPLGILLRSGDAGIAWRSFRGGIIDAFQSAKGNETTLRSLGKVLGTIDMHMTMEALGQEYGGVHMTGRVRRFNEGFFKWIGLSGWTRMTRMMALIGGQEFLLSHALKPGKNSERFLAQLNVKASDIHATPDGQLKLLTQDERSKATPVQREKDTRVKVALNRFVDEAILRPTAAQRPMWANDPHFQLVFHMKSFTYAFTTRILARVLSEAEEGNLMPLMQASMFIPTMIGAQLLRGFVTTGGIPANEKNWGVMDYVAEAANRQNLYGLGSFGVDAKKDIQYGGLGVSSFLGPTLSQFAQIPGMLTGNLGDLQHAMPMSNVWRQW